MRHCPAHRPIIIIHSICTFSITLLLSNTDVRRVRSFLFPSTASQGNNRKVSRGGVGPSDQSCRMSSIFCIAIHDEALLQGVSERLHWFTTELWGFDEKGGEVAQPCNRLQQTGQEFQLLIVLE